MGCLGIARESYPEGGDSTFWDLNLALGTQEIDLGFGWKKSVFGHFEECDLEPGTT